MDASSHLRILSSVATFVSIINSGLHACIQDLRLGGQIGQMKIIGGGGFEGLRSISNYNSTKCLCRVEMERKLEPGVGELLPHPL